MKVAVFSSKTYDRRFLEEANAASLHDLSYFEAQLSPESAALANGFPAVCVFVHDRLERDVLTSLCRGGTRLIALRCAGFNNVDLEAAQGEKMTVVRVPAYSPYSVAEHTIGLILTLNRKIHRAYGRVREGNFALDGLLGFDLRNCTVGIIGTGKIGLVVARILSGFGCRLLAHDPFPNPEVEEVGARYAPLNVLYAESDIITLHAPLTSSTYRLIDTAAVERMKRGVMIVNTSRGKLIDTLAVIEGLKSGEIGYLGLDVYEEEENLFFKDLSEEVLHDDVFARLLTFPNVVITSHQAYFTEDALRKIAETTLSNITAYEQSRPLVNEVTAEQVRP